MPTLKQLEELEALNTISLEALSVIMGIPKSGTKQIKIERLWAVAEVRGAMKDFANPQSHDEAMEIAQEIAGRLLGKQLKALCKKAKVYAPGTTKPQISLNNHAIIPPLAAIPNARSNP